MGVFRHLSACAGAAIASFSGAPVLAQSSLGAPTREELERLPAPALPSATERNLAIESGIERAPCPLAAPDFQNISITLSAVEFSGLPAELQPRLAPAYASSIGKTVAIASVCDIRDQAATILRRAGYLAAVQVPPQRIENGAIRFDVLLARIVGFQVRGDAGKSERMIEAYLEEIRKQPVFNLFEAERYLLLARDIPGLDVRMTLRPAGTAAGEVIGDVQLLRTPIELDANIQNSGSKEAGRFGGLAQLRLNGLFGAGDRTIVGAYSTADFEEQTVIQIGQEFRIGREGLTIAGDFTHAWTRPTIDPAIDLRTRTLVASLEARYPIVRRQTRNLFGSIGFDAINQRTRFNTLPLTRDRLRVLYGRLDFDAIDELSLGTAKGYSPAEPRWRAAGSIELRQGLGILGASKSCGAGAVACAQPGTTPPSRLAADTTAFLVRAGGLVETRPVPAFAISVSPRIQYARRPLLSYEEFSAGNFTVGRGYDPGTLIGDSGAGIATELRLGSLVPNSARDAAFQAYFFMDSAWVWNRDRIAGTADPQRLVSTGAGLRVVQGNRVNLDVAGAVPLKRAGLQTERGDVRLLVNLSVRLLPWKRR